MKYGILGHPLKHTMSPFIHKRLFLLSGKTDAEYAVYDLSDTEFTASRDTLRALDGLNVTIPYKIPAIGIADRVTEGVERFCSVNCFDNKNGTVTGYNTDVDGFTLAIAELGGALDGNVLLLGAGGVAQMMAVTAVSKGASLTIAVRTADLPAAEALAARASAFGKRPAVTTLDKILGRYDLLINATPVGMYPNTDACPVADEVIRSVAAVYDAVYNPSETQLYQKARSFGIPSETGMSMLVYQAVKAHEIWYGASFSNADVRALIADATRYMEENFK